MSDAKAFGGKLRSLRRPAGLTLLCVKEKSGLYLNVVALSDIERGIRLPTKDELERIVKACGAESELTGLTEELWQLWKAELNRYNAEQEACGRGIFGQDDIVAECGEECWRDSFNFDITPEEAWEENWDVLCEERHCDG